MSRSLAQNSEFTTNGSQRGTGDQNACTDRKRKNGGEVGNICENV